MSIFQNLKPSLQEQPQSEPVPNPWEPIINAINTYNKDLPKNWTSKNFDNFERESGSQLDMVVKVLSKRDLNDPVGVFLSGGAGCGKTHLLLSLMSRLAWFYYYAQNGINDQIKFYNYSDLCGILRQDPNNFELFCKIRKPAYLFIDDLGVSKTSDFVQEKIYSIFNYRVENELPTFVSTNLTIQEIANEFTERMTSRIKQSSVWVELKNQKDYRSKHFIENMNKYKKIMEAP